MEKAKYLPRIGIFGEEYVFNGNRNTENGYSAGVYLQWNIFSPNDYGSSNEAILRAKSMEWNAKANAEQESILSKGLTVNILALRENIKLLADSDSLLREQTKVAADLFKNGSINALQMIEAFSRRIDLIANDSEAQILILKLSAEYATKAAMPEKSATHD